MRVLFTVPPALGHLFPVIPLAWAFRSAGHEVLVASAGSATVAAVRAGLPAVDVAPGADFAVVFGQSSGSPQERATQLRERGQAMLAAGGRTPDLFLPPFARLSELMADGTLRLAVNWVPDLLVHSRLQGAGPMAARALGVPAVEHGFGFLRDAGFGPRLLAHLGEVYRRHGVPPELPRSAIIHVGPPSMMTGDGTGWSMRYVPYNAGGVLPDWLTARRTRRRVAVTLGTVVPRMTGIGGLVPTLAAAAGCDAEFILALDDADAADLGPVPDNVRVAGWVPLAPLLSTCDALVHHGGAGTTLTAVCAGVPQLILPHGADQFGNAAIVTDHGLGLTRQPGEVDAATLETLLADEKLCLAAAAVAAEVADLPSPADMVEPLAQFGRDSSGGPV